MKAITILNPELSIDKKALIQSSLEAGLSSIAVAKLTNILYNTIYIYYRKFQDFKKLALLKFTKLGLAKVMSIYMKDISK